MSTVMAPHPDAAVAWHYGSPVAEARALETGRAIVDLPFEVVTVSGPDRLTWLHAFTSQHLAALPPGTSTEALILSPHGHVEHAFAVVDDGERTWLVTDVGGGEPLVAFLESMQFAARVDVAARPDLAVVGRGVRGGGEAWEVIGWQDPWPRTSGTSYSVQDTVHPGAAWVLRLSVVQRAEREALAARWVADGGSRAGMWAFEAARIAAWRPRAARELDDRSIPHELDWLRTAVHLGKGCYRGQETVARVVNLGRPPRRLVFLHLDGSVDELPVPGTAVTSAGRVVGRLTSAARHHELGPIALAVVKRSVDPAATLLVGAATAAQDIVVRPEGTADATPVTRPGAEFRRAPVRR